MLATPPMAPDTRAIALNHIQPDPSQVRREFDQEALEQLAASIREHGVIEPIVVQPTPAETDGQTHVIPFQIIAGERRWRAARIAELEFIPAIVRTDLSADQAKVIQVLENLQRESLTLHELSAGVSILVDKLGLQEAAKQLGQSKAWVSRHATLRELPEQVRALVEEGKLESAEMAADLGKMIELAPDNWRTTSTLSQAEAGTLNRAGLRASYSGLKAEIERNEEYAREREEDQKRLNGLGKQQNTAGNTDDEERLPLEEDEEEKAIEKLRADYAQRLEQLRKELEPALADLYVKCATALCLPIEHFEDTQEVKVPEHAPYCEVGMGFTEELPNHYKSYATGTLNILPANVEDVLVAAQFTLPLSRLRQALVGISGTESGEAKVAMPPRFESVRTFLAQATKPEDGAKVESSALFEAYGKFCKKAKLEGVDNANEFSTTLEILGQQKKRLESGRAWINLKLVKA